jgi:protein-S-isoprenylcysteine O-methyltransferase Ste14
MTHPLPFVWPYAGAFWIVITWGFFPEFGLIARARIGGTHSADAGSMRLIFIGNQLSMLFAFVAAWIFPFASFRAGRVAAFWTGLVVFGAGVLLRRHCFRTLGKFFTGAVMVQADQTVIDRGAYRWVRHPSYTGGILMWAGMGIALENWISVALLLAVTILVYSYRVSVEERALLQQLGEPYRAYMARSKRFIPFVI